MGQINSKDKIRPKNINAYTDFQEILKFKTKESLINCFGSIYKTNKEMGFFARSIHEESYLVGKSIDEFDERLEWNLNGNYIVAYIKDNNVLKFFR